MVSFIVYFIMYQKVQFEQLNRFPSPYLYVSPRMECHQRHTPHGIVKQQSLIGIDSVILTRNLSAIVMCCINISNEFNRL